MPATKRGESKGQQWLHVNASYESDDCLIWPFSTARGYGAFAVYQKHYYAHRYMCELVHGPAPEDKPFVAHSCGNGDGGCVNPKHLRWSSLKENSQERRAHGTENNNPNGPAGILSHEDVEQIRALAGKKTRKELAEMFGVHTMSIRYWQIHDRPPSKRMRKTGAGVAYVPAGKRAAAAVAANPEKSDRAIAAELGVSPTTVGKARKSHLANHE